jgi:uncharacterized protein (TIRG00374 family)
VLLSGVFVYLASRDVEPARIGRALSQADYRLVLPAALLSYAVVWVRAMRWRILLKGLKEIPTGSLFRAIVIGFTANYVLPARIGELVRAYLVGKREKVGVSPAFASVVVERLLDVFTILLVFAGVSLLVEVPRQDPRLESAFRTGALVMLGFSAMGALLIGFIRFRTDWIARGVRKGLGWVSPRLADRAGDLVSAFARGVVPVRGGADQMKVVVYTVILWVLSATAVVLVVESFRLGLPWDAAWLILVALAFGVSVPSAPGFVGTFHYAAVLCLLLYGVDPSEALSFAIVLHATNLGPIFLLGVVFLWREGLSLAGLARVKREEMGTS